MRRSHALMGRASTSAALARDAQGLQPIASVAAVRRAQIVWAKTAGSLEGSKAGQWFDAGHENAARRHKKARVAPEFLLGRPFYQQRSIWPGGGSIVCLLTSGAETPAPGLQRQSLVPAKGCCRRRKPGRTWALVERKSIASFLAQLPATRCRSSKVVWDKNLCSSYC